MAPPAASISRRTVFASVTAPGVIAMHEDALGGHRQPLAPSCVMTTPFAQQQPDTVQHKRLVMNDGPPRPGTWHPRRPEES